MGKRRRSATVEAQESPRGQLEEAFPSPPSRNPRYGFYCTNAAGAFTYKNFYGKYAARHFIDFLAQGSPIKWVNPFTIKTEGGIVIKTSTSGNPRRDAGDACTLEEVLDYEMNDLEANWEPPSNIMQEWERFLVQTPEVFTMGNSGSTRSSRPQRSEDNTTVAELAEELGMEPRQARQILRKAKTPKPPQGWEWPEDEVDAIKEILRKGAK